MRMKVMAQNLARLIILISKKCGKVFLISAFAMISSIPVFADCVAKPPVFAGCDVKPEDFFDIVIPEGFNINIGQAIGIDYVFYTVGDSKESYIAIDVGNEIYTPKGIGGTDIVSEKEILIRAPEKYSWPRYIHAWIVPGLPNEKIQIANQILISINSKESELLDKINSEYASPVQTYNKRSE
jgi:hypothetical protein